VMHQRVDQALHRMGIEHLRDRAISTLSGGERQRCALAGVLAMRPGLVVLDEPFSQLDTAGAAALTAILQHLRDDGIGCIVAEHRRPALEMIADSRMTMQNGAVHQVPERTARTARAEPPVAAVDAPVAWTLDGVIAGHGSDAVLHDVSVRGRCGEVTLLTGANGSGKTTLLRTIAGLMPPLAGSVERAPGRVAYLPQNPLALLHRATVADEVSWTMRRDRTPPSDLLDALGIAHLAHRYPRDLSTGEQQRAALAAVLAGTPRIALLDEPTRGMDEAARDALVTVVRSMCERGCSVVLATHDEDLAAALATERLVLADGVVSTQRAAEAVTA
ncbi:MAG: ATP-binding cassette domain-containing protein, partial [Candidatus Dormibacteraeota bacterium]|nr:ATP-binding cassette domain-containing protein [Candidatus Dormibacteraeota bacterium]